ncbi:16S rRNA (cytidine(1402)-2'-O)-methyltransferase [Buchnera aphidicola]|uniref:16S rRNA (cytidine(1402)-2'-O)-methyltransferase n=1 Tax=Buchnera aphidicola TaxID=9 RepID=UPI0030EC6A75
MKTGTLYIIATPIGNIKDITYRAIKILKKIDFILAENCFNTLKILKKFKIKKKMISFHEHNEKKKLSSIILKLKNNYKIALISNAGTPLINDPGFNLVKKCHKKKIKVVPIPGACAAITALCSSGISSNKFLYVGFLPLKKKKCIKTLKKLSIQKFTLIIYESKYRIINNLKRISKIFEKNRKITIARELTKYWENIYQTKVGNLIKIIKKKKIIFKGEFVIIIEKYKKKLKSFFKFKKISKKKKIILKILKKKLSCSKAAYIASKIFLKKKKFFYKYFMKLKK